MSELRERCREWIRENFSERRSDGNVYSCQVFALEAFAKEQQIKGMEAARDLTHTHHAPFHWYFEWLRKKIDAEIKQLKEGG